MITVYKGNTPMVKNYGFLLRKNVPTYIPDSYSYYFQDEDIYEDYDPNKKYNSEKILIILPSESYLLFPALSIINRFQEWFPTCELHYVGSPNFEFLFSDKVYKTSYNMNLTGKYYRVYNFSKRNVFIKNKFQEINLINISYPVLFLQALNLYDFNKHKNMKIELPEFVKGDKILVVKEKMKKNEKLEKVEELLNDEFDVEVFFDKGMNHDLIKFYKKLMQSEFVIFMSDNVLSFVSGYLNVPTFVFGTRKARSIDYQYKYLPNVKKSFKSGWQNAEPDVIFEKLSILIKNERSIGEQNEDTRKAQND